MSVFPASVWAAGRTLADPHLSSDGTLVAFVASIGTSTNLVIRHADGGAEQYLPCSPAVKRIGTSSGGGFDWLPDADGIVYLGVDGGLHRLDLANHGCRPLHIAPGAVANLSVSPDGNRVAYVSDLQDVFVSSTDPIKNETIRLSAGNDFALDPSWTPDSTAVAWQEWDDPHMAWDESRIAIRDVSAKYPVAIIDVPNSQAQQPRFSPDGTRLAFMCDATGWLVPWTTLTTELSPEPLVQDADAEFEYGEPSWGPGQRSYCWTNDGTTIVAARNHGGWGRLVSIDVDGEVIERGDGLFSALHSDGMTDSFVAITQGPTESTVINYGNDDEILTVAQASFAGLEIAGVEPELVSWTSGEFEIHGRLYKSDVDNAPLMVWIHGGPTGQSTTTLFHRFSYFLQRGYSILVPDYRGSSGWGRDFQQALNGNWGTADVEDVIAGVRAAEANGWTLPGNTILYGGSAGGFTALLVLAREPDLCAGAAVMYPVCDLVGFADSTWRFEAHYLETLIGPEAELAAEYALRSPISHASEITRPLLVLHGSDDQVVPVEQSRALVEVIRAGGTEVEFSIYEGEGHGWKSAEAIANELTQIEGFLGRLKGNS